MYQTASNASASSLTDVQKHWASAFTGIDLGSPAGGTDMAAAKTKGGGPAEDRQRSATASGQKSPPTQPMQSEFRLSNPPPIALPALTTAAAGGAAGNGVIAAGGGNDGVHAGFDASGSYPWQAQATLVLRNFNLKTYSDPQKQLAADLFHEPNLSLTLDPASGLSAQQMVALLNMHWIPPWRREIEAPLSVFINEALSKQHSLVASGGVQLQVEQHICSYFSLTASMSGTIGYHPPEDGAPPIPSDRIVVSANVGVLLHLY